MQEFLQGQLVGIQARQKILKLFIFGARKKSILSEQKILDKLQQDDYVLIYFTEFTLVLFYEQYHTPNKLLKYAGGEFKVMKSRYRCSWHDFIFDHLIGKFKFVLDDCNSVEHVMQILDASQNKENVQNLKENKVEVNQFDESINQIDENINQIDNAAQDDEIISENPGLDSVKEDLSEIKSQLELQKEANQKKEEEIICLRNDNTTLKRKFADLEKLKDEEISELSCNYKKQANQFQSLMTSFEDQQRQIQRQQTDFSQFKLKVENEIAEYKKRSMDKKQVIEEQKDRIKEEEVSRLSIIEQSEQRLAEELKKKSTEKRKLIGLKEEEIKTCEEALNFREEIIKFFVVCFPGSKNQIREKLFNFGNDDVKTGYFSNVEKMQQFINQQYRSKSPTPIKNIKTPVQTPVKTSSNSFKSK